MAPRPPAGPWVPPPARASHASLPYDALSPLKLRISEMEALAGLLGDSGLSAGGDSSPDSRHASDSAGAARTRLTESRPFRGRRKPAKAASSSKFRRTAPVEDTVPARRRTTRDVAPPSPEPVHMAAPSVRPAPQKLSPPKAGRPARVCSGQSAPVSDQSQQPPSPPPPAPPPAPVTEQRGLETGGRQTNIGVFDTVAQLPPGELVPALSELLPGADSSLHEVLEKFLWAKQQASAAANLMSCLRQAVERMDQDQSRSTAAARDPATSDAVSQTSLGSERSVRAPSSSASAPAVTQTVSQAVTQAVTHAVTQAVTQAVTEQAATQQQAITTHSSLLATSCSLSARRWPGGGALPSAGSDGTVSPAESVSVLPEESRSQLIHTGTESRGSRSRRGTNAAAAAAQGSDDGWRSASVSDTALSRRGAPPAAPASQQRQVESLRRQYQRQQEKLRRLEQTNYVLNLAVDGQDKTIRTLSTQLEDTKEALLQEISQQPAPGPTAEVNRRRGLTTQTGPSLTALSASGGASGATVDGSEPPPGCGGGSASTAESERDDGGGGGRKSVSVGVSATMVERRPVLVETATSPVPEPEPELLQDEELQEQELDHDTDQRLYEGRDLRQQQERRLHQEAEQEKRLQRQQDQEQRGQSGPRSDPADSGDELNRREVQRLLAALDAKERELAALRAHRQRRDATTEEQSFRPDQAFISTPTPSGGMWTEQGGGLARPGVTAVAPHSVETWRRTAAGATTTAATTAPRAWSTEAFRQWERPASAEQPPRRHSFTAPAPQGGWRPPAVSEPVARAQRSLLAEFDRVDAAASPRPPPTAASSRQELDECARLEAAVSEGRARIRRLEEEIFELKCARRQQDGAQAVPAAADRPRLADCLLTPDGVSGGGAGISGVGGGGGGGMAAGDPFPNIVRLTESKLQEAYQLLVRERRRGVLLTKQAREAAHRLEQTAAATNELKQQLASSIQERQQLQEKLTAAETTGTELNQQLRTLREEVQSKETQLTRTSQHLEERVAQVSALSRELESARAEAARDERAAAARLDELLSRASRLEEAADALRMENRRLGAARDEAGQLAASEKRLRQRVTELQERLEQSDNNAKMLENYIHFLKSSYNSMFGVQGGAATSPGGTGGSLASFDGHGAARSLFNLSGK